MASLTGNKFEPTTDLPDLAGKVCSVGNFRDSV